MSPAAHFFDTQNNKLNLGYGGKKVTVIIGQDMRRLLYYCRQPRDENELYKHFNRDTVKKAKEEKLIFGIDKVHITDFEMIEVEINTLCNYKCIYCPNSSRAQKGQTMSMQLFHKVIQQAEACVSIRYVTLNFYNEPLLDSHFEQRLECISQSRLKLILHTNASMLNRSYAELLLRYQQCLHIIQINIPSVDCLLYRKYTGNGNIHSIKHNLEQAYALGLPLGITVNGKPCEISDNLPEIQRQLGDYLVYPPQAAITTDRAGELKGEYCKNIHIRSKLAGCPIFAHQLIVLWNGDMTVCCNDYRRKYVYASLEKQNLHEILCSDQRKRLYHKIYGVIRVEDDFICRKCWHAKSGKISRSKLVHALKFQE